MSEFNSVLIIDDDPILRAISQSYFAALGTESIFVAGNGHQALQVISDQAGAIEFVLCDLNMPELDGVEFLRHLSECNFAGAIGIISGEDASIIDTAGNLAKSYGLNIVGTIQKPLEKTAFDALLKAATQQAHPQTDGPKPKVTAEKLSAAIKADQLISYYQPKIEVPSGKISGVEALVRWQHPVDGLIGPDAFIPCAEQSGLIGALTDGMLKRAIDDAVSWGSQGIRVRMAINVAPEALDSHELPDKLERQVTDAGLDPGQFTFEITERNSLQSSPVAMEVVARMRLKGFDISIDDFGTGSTNIEQLRDFPYSELKIDRSFIQSAANDRFARACIKASAVFARELNMRLVAEGVSNHAEWELATQERVDEIQGFLIARPMPAEEFVAWYKANDGAMPSSLLASLQDPEDTEARRSLDELLRQANG